MSRPLPKGFKLGVASPACQIDGPSGKTRDGWEAEDAYKSYQFYLQDIPMAKWLGVDFFRFSISWSRILPTGFAHNISKEGSDYYKRFIDALIARGIEPMVTMYHWDLPQNLQDLGGWTNPMIIDWFEDYARVLFDLYGGKVKTWITINDPKQAGQFGYGIEKPALGVKVKGLGDYLAAKHMILAHAKAWHLYDKEYRAKQEGKCGIAIATNYLQGLTDSPSDEQAGLDAMDFEVGLYAHPIFSGNGGFPDSVVQLVAERSKEQGYPRSRLADFTEDEREFVKGTSDFYGFNHYSTRFYTRGSYQKDMFPVPSLEDDLGATYVDAAEMKTTVSVPDVKKNFPLCTEMPHGIRKALNWVKDTYSNPTIMITENGFGTLGGLPDYDRVSYMRSYINAVLDAIEKDQCRVVAYTAWSLMDDDYEVDSGLNPKFGLFETNYKEKEETRNARASAFWYRKLTGTRVLDLDYTPTFKKISF